MMKKTAATHRRNSIFVRRGSVHSGKMKEVDVAEEYNIVRQLGSGRFGTLHLAEHKQSQLQIALKIFPKGVVKQTDFLREYNYSYFLSPHPNVVDTYEGTFTTKDGSFFFVQEFAPRGSLQDLIQSTGSMPEPVVKEVMKQVLAAVEFMHSEKLVHRNLKADNVLIFGSNPRSFDKVKIADFGLTRKEESLVKHIDSINAYHAPELCDTLQKETYSVDSSVDIWALGILIYYALRGRFPWNKASITCKSFWEWEEWLKRKYPHLPKRWSRFTEKALKLFKKTLNPKAKDRCTAKEIKKLLKDKWMKELKSVSEEDLGELDDEKMGRSFANLALPGGAHGERKSILHQWFATTLSTMSEISEQMVSAED